MAEITSIYGNPIRDKSTYTKTESDARYVHQETGLTVVNGQLCQTYTNEEG